MPWYVLESAQLYAGEHKLSRGSKANLSVGGEGGRDDTVVQLVRGYLRPCEKKTLKKKLS